MGRRRIPVPPCRLCGKEFKRHEHLLRHERTHTPDKPFSCDCGERISRPDYLARHLRLFHREGNFGSERPTSEQSSLPGDAESSDHPAPPNFEITGHLKSAVAATDHLFSLSTTPDFNEEPIQGHATESAKQGDFASLAAQPFDHVDPWHMNDDLNFFWDDEWSFPGVLPASFFDTTISLADISHQYYQNRPVQEHGRKSSEIPDLSSGYAANDEAHNLVTESETDPSQNFRLEGNVNPSIAPWKISISDYEEISREMQNWSSILPANFLLPSRHTLSRFLEGYFRGFHEHMPFLHSPSCSALSLGLELILPLAAVGALYRFEHAKGYRLYQAARALIDWRLNQRNGHALSRATNTSPDYASFPKTQNQVPYATASSDTGKFPSKLTRSIQKLDLKLLQALVVLMAMATWGDQAVVQDSLAMSGQVALLVREIGISMPDASHESKYWERWVDEEERRRTLYVAYILFNLQCVAFNVPPMILNKEVCLILPACGVEWTAPNAQEWERMRALHVPTSRPFQQVLAQLTQGNPFHKPDAVSSFANYVLIHGLVQEIFFTRNTTSLMELDGSLRTVFVQTMEAALGTWQQSWCRQWKQRLVLGSSPGRQPMNPRWILYHQEGQWGLMQRPFFGWHTSVSMPTQGPIVNSVPGIPWTLLTVSLTAKLLFTIDLPILTAPFSNVYMRLVYQSDWEYLSLRELKP